jgi:hypothetical protein
VNQTVALKGTCAKIVEIQSTNTEAFKQAKLLAHVLSARPDHNQHLTFRQNDRGI